MGGIIGNMPDWIECIDHEIDTIYKCNNCGKEYKITGYIEATFKCDNCGKLFLVPNEMEEWTEEAMQELECHPAWRGEYNEL